MIQRPSHSAFLRVPFIYSAIIHAALVVFLLIAPNIQMPFHEKKVTIDVQWMELPKGTSDEIGEGMKKAEDLPKSTIEEQQKFFQPEPTQQQAMTPEIKPLVQPPPIPKAVEKVKPTPPKPVVDPSKMARSDPKAKPPVPATKTDKAIANALRALDKEDTKARQVTPESANTTGTDGFKYGTGNKPLKVSPSDPEYIRYQATVRGKIKRSWVTPGVTTDDSGRRLKCSIVVRINSDGDVTAKSFAGKSGNPSFDQSAMRAVAAASPFPRPPERMAWEALNEGFYIAFSP